MRRIVIALAALLLAFAVAGEALAQPSLDQARRDGLVGERIDGYVGIVDAGAGADVRALVDRVNAERRAEYERIARQQGQSVDVIANVAGRAQIERMPPGVYVLGADGVWRRK